MRLLWQFLAVAAVWIVGNLGMAAVKDSPWLALVAGLSTAVVAVAVYRWVVRRTEHRNPDEVSAKGAGAGVGWGTLLGVALFGAVIATIALLGDYTINGLGTPENAVALLGIMAGAAVTEELLFRGVLFRNVERWTGTWIALVLTGALFGLIHLLNANATLVGAVAIAISAGGMLTAAYVATRKLWLPIGLHFGWNIAVSAIFSTEVSGTKTRQGLLDTTISGPTLVTGGAFGPEASVFTVVLGVVATGVLMWLAHRRGRVVPVRRSTRVDVPAELAA
ncbi:CPBP family intramembrane glutamic endopeptidase [Luteimicrobium sp. DT211]|uniref:CPBP family intramembrane glutamic endopeptidase n=1 Tax=Luteimicrobium sp. DT211 TaxID=3393412 RepID=UPI003CF9A64E